MLMFDAYLFASIFVVYIWFIYVILSRSTQVRVRNRSLFHFVASGMDLVHSSERNYFYDVNIFTRSLCT